MLIACLLSGNLDFISGLMMILIFLGSAGGLLLVIVFILVKVFESGKENIMTINLNREEGREDGPR
jgi:hypothetical protein